MYGEVFNERRDGYFVDIGAHDGIYINNTYLLERRYNWSGICVEANPITFSALKKNRRANCLNVCLDRAEADVDFVLRDVLGGIVDQRLDNTAAEVSGNTVVKLKTTTLLKILTECNAPAIIDYLSIDVEGAEERILGEFDFGLYKFKCITIERPNGHLREVFSASDYVLVKELPGLDCFYVHREFLQEYRLNLFQFFAKKHVAIRWR